MNIRKGAQLIAVLLLMASVAFAQGSEQKPPKIEGKTVSSIEVKGNKSISTNTIISKLRTRVGDIYQENVISDDLKRLYLLGFFEDIKIDTEDYKEGFKVVINVVERPIIDKITFSGMNKLAMKDKKLKETLKSKETQYLDYPSLDEDLNTLKKMYEKKGYSKADIKYNVAVDKTTDKASVQFLFVEGGRIKVRDIKVEGNNSFPDKRILKLMKTKKAWLFRAGILKDDTLKEDIERIKSFYQRAGFADAVVEHKIDQDPKKPFLYITITVQEGKKYVVGSLVIQGNKDVREKDILSRIKETVPGKVFSQEAMKQDIASIQSLYFDKGYISAKVEELTSINAQTSRVDIVYNVTENEISYVNKIKIRGNVKTRDVVIRREMRIKPGERFDGEKLKRSKERLQNLGFFEEVSYDVEDTQVPNSKDLIVEVKETKTGTFSFGGGYSTVDSFVGFFEIEQTNFDWKNFPYFTGAGQDLKFRASLGSITNSFDLSFTNPWVFDYPFSFGFDAYRRSHDRDSDVGYGYNEEITGGDLRLGKELSEYIKGSLTYRFDNLDISDINEQATEDLKSEAGSTNISSLTPTLVFDNRDNVFDTTRGEYLENSFEVAGGPFGGDRDFIKYYSRASHYIPLFRGSALELRGRLGFAKPYGDSEKVPIYDRFFAGGAYTIRGYNERKVGPIDQVTSDPLGGEAMLIGNIEYTYPLFKFLKVAAFYDIGNVWYKSDDFGNGGFKAGFGLGVRIKTPIGPILLDYGFPANKEPGEEHVGDGKFHFSMRQGF